MNALQLLQQKAGVEPDGVFGPNTFRAAKQLLNLSDNGAVHFFAQLSHETGNFKRFEENLNYSAERLVAVWPKRFTAESAKAYHRNPEKIANKVYGGRMGNGDVNSGDGWKFRGRGAIQLTGRFNYQQFSVFVDDHSILENPDSVATKYAFDSAMNFFKKKNIWQLCEEGFSNEVIKLVTKVINGGTNGLGHRIELTNKYRGYLV